MKLVYSLLMVLALHTGLAVGSDNVRFDWQNSVEPVLTSSVTASQAPSCQCSYPPGASYCSITCNPGQQAICNLSHVLEECRCYCQ